MNKEHTEMEFGLLTAKEIIWKLLLIYKLNDLYLTQ